MNSLYNVGERVDVARAPSDAFLVFNSADRSSSTSAVNNTYIPLSQPYNNFRLQKPENLVQGGFTRLQLTEINFPYAIPNLNERNNFFWVVLRRVPGDVVAKITIPPLLASVDGDYIATQVQAALNASAVGGASATWAVVYTGGGFKITMTPDPVGIDFALYPVAPVLNFPAKPTLSADPTMYKSLLDLMGFDVLSNWDYWTGLDNTTVGATVVRYSVYSSLLYTNYIDIVSNKLTYYANVKDGSTKKNSGSSVICRLYISNETSSTAMIGKYYDGAAGIAYTQSVAPGVAPFTIHRQFVSPKQFKWEPNTAVDWIDIQLLDDIGQPLYIPACGLPDFQITFKATED